MKWFNSGRRAERPMEKNLNEGAAAEARREADGRRGGGKAAPMNLVEMYAR